MAKRVKRIKKGIESLKEEIEAHFNKIEEDRRGENIGREIYHIKEIDKGLLKALEIKIDILKIKDNSVEKYRERLERIKKELNLQIRK